MTPTSVITALRQALRPIDDEGQQHGGPDGWSPTSEEISEWEEWFREAANPDAIRTLLDAHASAVRDAAKLRELLGRFVEQDKQIGCTENNLYRSALAALDDNTKGAAE